MQRTMKAAVVEAQPLASINAVFDRMKEGKLTGRVVLALAER